MKKLVSIILNVVFALLCNAFRCNFKGLDSVYQAELPASPKHVRETKMYKRLHRFVKLCLAFRKFDLVLEMYSYLPASVGRCIWNIVRDETRYVLFDQDNSTILGKWSKRGNFIKVASIEKIDEERMEKYLLLISANYNNFVVGEASSLEEAEKLLAELPERIVVSESNGFDTDDYYLWKKNVVIVKSK